MILGSGLRRLAKATKDAGQSRRCLALAGIYDGGARSDAARMSGGRLRGPVATLPRQIALGQADRAPVFAGRLLRTSAATPGRTSYFITCATSSPITCT